MADAEPVMENPFSPAPQPSPATHSSQMARVVKEIIGYIVELKSEYDDYRCPLTDDCQSLQKFCSKLEYCMQCGIKPKSSLLGGKKDYWNFIMDCLSSNKSLNDGIRFVKSISELKTSVGRGRALLRFALVHQRLADTLQQCAMCGRLISDWYHPSALWHQQKLLSELLNALYDLNDIQFDLSPRGYDLDTSWPTFARRTLGSPQAWKPPSRTTSISSLSSIPALEVNLQVSPSPSPLTSVDPELLRLQHDLTTSEYRRQEVNQQLDTLEHDKMAAEHSAGDLQKKIGELQGLVAERDKQCTQLKAQNEQLSSELHIKEGAWQEKESLLIGNAENAEKKLITCQRDNDQNDQELKFDKVELAGRLLASQKVTEALRLELKSAELRVESAQRVDVQKTRLIELLDRKLDQVNNEKGRLADMVEQCIKEKEKMSAKLKEATFNITDIATRLSDSEKRAKELRNSNKEYLTMLHSMQDKGTQIAKVAKEKLTKYSAENKLLKAEIATMGEEGANVSEEVAKADKLSESVNQLDEIQKQLASLETLAKESPDSDAMKALKTSGTLNREIRAEVDKLKADLKAKEGLIEQERAVLRERIAAVEKERDELKKSATVVGTSGGGDKVVQLTTDRSSLKFVLEEKKKVLEQAQAEASKLREILSSKLANNKAAADEGEAAADEGKAGEGAGAVEGGSGGEGEEELLHRATVEAFACEISNILEASFTESDVARQVDGALEQHEALSGVVSGLRAELLEAESRSAQLLMTVGKRDTQIGCAETERDEAERVLAEREEREEALQRELSRSEYALEQFKQEMKTSAYTTGEKDQTISNLTSSLEETGQSLSSTIREREEAGKRAARLQAELDGKVREVQRKTEEYDRSQGACDSLQRDKANLTDENDSLRGKVGKLERDIAEHQRNAAELEQSLNFTAEEKLTLLHAKVKSEQETNSQLHTDVAQLQDSLVKQKRSLTDNIDKSACEIQRLSKALDRLQSECEVSLDEKDAALSQVGQYKEDEVRSGEKIAALQGELGEHERSAAVMTLDVQRLETELGEKTTALTTAESTLTEAQSANTDLESQKQTLEGTVASLQIQVTEQEKSIAHSGDELQTAKLSIREKAQELCSAEDKLKFLEESRQSIQSEFEVNRTQVSALQQAVHALEAERGVLHESLRTTEADAGGHVEAVRDENELLRGKIEQLLAEKDAMCHRLTEEKAVLHDQLTALSALYETRSAHLAELQESLDNTQTTLEGANRQLKEASEAAERARKEMETGKAEFDKKLGDLGLQLDAVTRDKGAEIARLNEDFAITQESLERRGKLWDGERSGLEQELSALKFRLSSEQMEYQEKLQSFEDQHADVNGMRDRISQQEALIETLEVELRAQQAEREEEREHSWDQIKEHQDKLNALESDHMLLRETYDHTRSGLQEQTMSNRKLMKNLEESNKNYAIETETLNARIHELEADCMELKKKLIQLVREKDTLWQKTDQLEYEQKLRAADTWMDSSRVTTCLACKTEFSILRRKHHCRLCGNIFCWECCNNWVMTAHSGKKERVCNRCDLNASHLNTASDGNDKDGEEDGEPEVDIYTSVEIPQKRSRKWTETPAMSTPEEDGEDPDELVGTPALMALASSAIAGAGVPGRTSTPSKEQEGGSPLFNLATDEERLLMMTDDTQSGQAAAQSQASVPSEDEVYDFITDEEIAKSIMDPVPDPSMTITGTVTAASLLGSSVHAVPDLWIKAGKSFAVPILIDTSEVQLCWEFTTQPKPIHFSVTYKANEFVFNDDCEQLIPSTKCNSHKETITGDLVARKPGIYMLIFDNGPSRFTAKLLNYSVSAKVIDVD